MNAERLLGILLGGLSSKNDAIKTALGMGILGTAVAAFEHFSNSDSDAEHEPVKGSGTPMPPPPPRGTLPPPPPPLGTAVPSDFFGVSRICPPPPPPGSADVPAGESESLVLVRAMIAAAAADGTIDEEERKRILAQVEQMGGEDSDREFLNREMQCPRSLSEVLASVTSRAVGERVYLVSLLAMTVDTPAEIQYMEHLAWGLGLQPEDRRRLERQMD